jgi:hypothetical protein
MALEYIRIMESVATIPVAPGREVQNKASAVGTAFNPSTACMVARSAFWIVLKLYICAMLNKLVNVQKGFYM